MVDMIGVFGGTFDPPHRAHYALAKAAYENLHLIKVLWVPTSIPPHKSIGAAAAIEDRLGMVEAIIESDPEFELSLVDVNRPPPYYAYQTLELLRDEHPDPLIYLMGSDSLRDLPTWKLPMRFLDACDRIGVMERAAIDHDLDNLESQLPGVKKKIIMFPAPFLDISASDIRRRIREGLPYQDVVDPRVGAYIELHNLYK
jgi:nicotinate-nucleotide adenylyltransferase